MKEIIHKKSPIALVIHGGAGMLNKAMMSTAQQTAYKEELTLALHKGYKVLQNGGTSLQAIEQSITYLENCPLFNAGHGAVFTHNKTIELDAAMMDGKTLSAGAIAGVQHIKNPIQAAFKVLQNAPHVLLIGKGAEDFAKQEGITLVDNTYFQTEKRKQQLIQLQKKKANTTQLSESTDEKFGTVGAVALDQYGNLGAGTSTGGMTNKRFGRVGDSPIIGAGTYANNDTCAISATGHGEFFMRNVVAYDISARMAYQQLSLAEASEQVIQVKLKKQGGQGGIVGVDKKGNIVMPFNTSGMFRGYIDTMGNLEVKIFK